MNELFCELDEQARFEEFKDHPNESVRRELVYTLTDENLIHTFKDDYDWSVRQADEQQESDGFPARRKKPRGRDIGA